MGEVLAQITQTVAGRLFWVYFTLTLLLFLFGVGGVLGAGRAGAAVLLFWAFLLLAALVAAQPRLPGEPAGESKSGRKAVLYVLLVILSLIWLNLYVYQGRGVIVLLLLLGSTLWGLTFLRAGGLAFILMGVQVLALLGATAVTA